MLGLVLIYFIGKSFYKLAEEYGRSAWGYAILGIVVYYATMFLGQIIIAMIMLSNGNNVDESNELIIALIGIPFGLLGWWGLHSLLKKNWSKNPINKQEDVLDDVLID